MILKAGTYRFNARPTETYPLSQTFDYILIMTMDGETIEESYIGLETELYQDAYFSVKFQLNSTSAEKLYYNPIPEGYESVYVDGWLGGTPPSVKIDDTEVDDDFGTWFISSTNYNEVNGSTEIPLVELTYNGETLSLEAGDKATIPCAELKMRSDVVVKVNEVESDTGGGSSECSGEHVIPVDELPETGEDGAIYELTQKFSDVLVYMKDYDVKMLLSETMELHCYSVSTKPTENIEISNTDTGPVHAYYVEDENDIFMYADNAGTNVWVSFGEFGFGSYQGTISNADEATADGYYSVGGGIAYFQCINGTFEKMMYEKDAYIPTSEEKTVTPTKSIQIITPSNADYLSKVTVHPISSNYIVPSGTLTVEENGTHDVKNYASVEVAVPASYLVKTVDDLPTDAPIGSIAIVLGGE